MKSMKPERIGLGDRIDDLKEKSGWTASETPSSIVKTFEFESYSEAMSFLIEVGSLAEVAGTVPTIAIEDGNKVTLILGEEPVSGVTEADVAFAEALASI